MATLYLRVWALIVHVIGLTILILPVLVLVGSVLGMANASIVAGQSPTGEQDAGAVLAGLMVTGSGLLAMIPGALLALIGAWAWQWAGHAARVERRPARV